MKYIVLAAHESPQRKAGEGTNLDTGSKRTRWPPQDQLNIRSAHFKGQNPHKDL